MTYNDLYQQWRDWSHRTDLTDIFLDFILRMVITRLGEDLRAQANEITDTLNLTEGAAALPGDYKKMIKVSTPRYTLQYVTPRIKRERGEYTIEAGQLLTQESQVDLLYWAIPEKTGDGDQDKVLNEFPNLYLYNGLAQIGRYLHDPSIIVPNEQEYQVLIKDINTAASQQRAGENQVMGA